MRFLSRICLLFSFSLSLYLVFVSLSSGTVAGCGGGSPCDKVLSSDWAYIGIVPVSIPAVLAYGLLLVLPIPLLQSSRTIMTISLSVAVSIVLTVLWFVMVQIVVIGELCPFCMASHAFGSAGAVLFSLSLFAGEAGRQKGDKTFILGCVIGCAATIFFIGLQLILPGPERSVEFDVQTELAEPQQAMEAMPVVEQSDPGDLPVEVDATTINSLDDPATGTPTSAEQEPVLTEKSESISDAVVSSLTEVVEKLPAPVQAIEETSPVAEDPVRIYSIHGGEFSFPVNEIPGIGDSNAPNIMLNLIDFACDHCREHYRVLRKRAPWYEGEIFFGVLPLALNERCNPYFSMPGLPDYANCEYARLALAVWRKSPQHYVEFVDWLCEESSPPASLDASKWLLAKEHAEDLIGTDLLAQGWEDPWVDQMMQTLTELYGYNLKLTGESAIPQQFLNQKLRFGEITTESSFNMIMGLNYPIEIKRRR